MGMDKLARLHLKMRETGWEPNQDHTVPWAWEWHHPQHPGIMVRTIGRGGDSHSKRLAVHVGGGPTGLVLYARGDSHKDLMAHLPGAAKYRDSWTKKVESEQDQDMIGIHLHLRERGWEPEVQGRYWHWKHQEHPKHTIVTGMHVTSTVHGKWRLLYQHTKWHSYQLVDRGNTLSSLRSHEMMEWAGASDNALGDTGHDGPTPEDQRNAKINKPKQPKAAVGGSGDHSGMGTAVRETEEFDHALKGRVAHELLTHHGWRSESDERNFTRHYHHSDRPMEMMIVDRNGTWAHGHERGKRMGQGFAGSLQSYLEKVHTKPTNLTGDLADIAKALRTESEDLAAKIKAALPNALMHRTLRQHGWEPNNDDVNQDWSHDRFPGVIGTYQGEWEHGEHTWNGDKADYTRHSGGNGQSTLHDYLGKLHKMGAKDLIHHFYRDSRGYRESEDLADKIRAALPMAMLQQTLHKHGWRASRGNEGSHEIEFFHGDANHTAAGYHRLHARASGDWMFSKYNGHKRGGWEGLKMGKGHEALHDFLGKFHAGKLGSVRPSLKPHTVESADLAGKIKAALPHALVNRTLAQHGFEAVHTPGWEEPVGYGMFHKAPHSITTYHDGSWEMTSWSMKNGSLMPGAKVRGKGHDELHKHLGGLGMKAEAIIEAGDSWRLLTELSFTKAELERSLSNLDAHTASRWIALGGGHKKTVNLIHKLATVYGVEIPQAAHDTLKTAGKDWRKVKGHRQIKYYRKESLGESFGVKQVAARHGYESSPIQMTDRHVMRHDNGSRVTVHSDGRWMHQHNGKATQGQGSAALHSHLGGKTESLHEEEPIAHIWGGRVVACPGCNHQLLGVNPSDHSTPLYPVNVSFYHQTCHLCGKIVHAGGSGVELYDHPDKVKEGLDEGLWDRMKKAFSPMDPADKVDPDAIAAKHNLKNRMYDRGQTVKQNYVRDQGLVSLHGLTTRTVKDTKSNHPLGSPTTQQKGWRGHKAWQEGSGMGAGKRITFVLPPTTRAHHEDMALWRRLQTKQHYIVNSAHRYLRLKSVDDQHSATLDREQWHDAHVMVHPGMGPDRTAVPATAKKYTSREIAHRKKLGLPVESVLARAEALLRG